LLAVVSLFLWHAAHRIFHVLHDVGIHVGTGAKLLCYGSALLGTVIAAAALLSIGF
jgi:fumarate reductase subunit D